MTKTVKEVWIVENPSPAAKRVIAELALNFECTLHTANVTRRLENNEIKEVIPQ